MAFDGKGAGASRADPLNIVNPGRIDVRKNSEPPDGFQPSRRARLIAQRFGLPPATASLVADANGYSAPPDRPDAWASLGGVAASVVANLDWRRRR